MAAQSQKEEKRSLDEIFEQEAGSVRKSRNTGNSKRNSSRRSSRNSSDSNEVFAKRMLSLFVVCTLAFTGRTVMRSDESVTRNNPVIETEDDWNDWEKWEEDDSDHELLEDYDYDRVPETLDYYEKGDGRIDDILDVDALIDGEYYVLPCPLYEFTQNGWKIVNDEYDEVPETIGKYDYVYISLSKDAQDLSDVSLETPTGSDVPIEDSYVTGFMYSDYNPVDVQSALDIQLGDSDDHVKNQFDENGLDYSVDHSGHMNFYHIYKDAPTDRYPDRQLSYYVDTFEDEVVNIQIGEYDAFNN